MRILSIRRLSKRTWVILTEQRVLWMKQRTYWHGQGDPVTLKVSWIDHERRRPASDVMSMWLQAQLSLHIQERKHDRNS